MPSCLRSSGHKPMPAIIASRGDEKFTCCPLKVTLPECFLSTPKINRHNSVRPEPNNPARPTTSPLLTVISVGDKVAWRLMACTFNKASPDDECAWGLCSPSAANSLPNIWPINSARESVAVSNSPTNCALRKMVMRSVTA